MNLGQRTIAVLQAARPARCGRLPVFAVSEPSALLTQDTLALYTRSSRYRAPRIEHSSVGVAVLPCSLRNAQARFPRLLKASPQLAKSPSSACTSAASRPCCAPAQTQTPTPGTASACALCKVATPLNHAKSSERLRAQWCSVQVALSWHLEFTGLGSRGLTLPSRGRSKGRFAPFGPPLMSNVRPHHNHRGPPKLQTAKSHGLYREPRVLAMPSFALSFAGAYGNISPS